MTLATEPTTARDAPEACRACGAVGVLPHFAVRAGEARDLIPTTERYGHALADVARCPACGHMQLERFPPEDVLLRAYEEAESEDYVAEERGQRATAREALERIERWTAPGPLLDLGCWVGFLLAEARDRGWEPLGVEPSVFAADWARRRLGVDVVHANLFAADVGAGRWSAVVLGDVMEHLPEPGAALERIAELLAPEGVVYMTLPDAGSAVARRLGPRWWSVLPTHVQYFTRASIRMLLTRHGYTPLWIGTAPKAFTVDYYLGRLEGYSPPVSRALRRAAATTGVGRRLWAPDFRDRMGVLARRPVSA